MFNERESSLIRQRECSEWMSKLILVALMSDVIVSAVKSIYLMVNRM